MTNIPMKHLCQRKQKGENKTMEIIPTKTGDDSWFYVTSDGQEFKSALAAKDHEDDLEDRKKEDACAFLRRDVQAEELEVLIGRDCPSSHCAGLKVSAFYIRDEEELKLFCKGYASWDKKLCDFEKARKLQYPQEYFLFDGEFGYFFINKEEMKKVRNTFKKIATVWEE